MDRINRFFLNLAPEPPRNKNSFRLAVFFLSLLILFFLYLDFSSLYKGITSYMKNEKSIDNMRKELDKFSMENREIEYRLMELKKKFKKKVDLVNSLIEEKSLSWLSLLSIFEESLGEKTVLISLSSVSGSKILKAEISSEILDDLLKTVGKLSKNNFVEEVSIVREREKEGQKIFLISIKLKGQI